MPITKHIMSSLTGASLILFGLSACGQKASNSKLQITNGKEINETRYQSVIAIRSFGNGKLQNCTATFVNHYQAVTAAHCLEGLKEGDADIYAAKYDVNGKEITSFSAEAFKIHPLYDPSISPNPHDLAVVDFPRHSASTISLIASKVPSTDTWVQLVGYGDNENFYDESGHLSGSGSGKKRVGTNKIYSYEKDMLLIVGVPGTTKGVSPGMESCSGAGDSGGPLFINTSTLVGVTFGGGIHKEKDENGVEKITCGSYYVDVSRKENIEFLESVLKYDLKFEKDSQTL